MDSANSRLDAVSREIQELKTSIQFTQREVDDLKTNNARQSDHCNTMQTDILKIYDSLLAVTDKLDNNNNKST